MGKTDIQTGSDSYSRPTNGWTEGGNEQKRHGSSGSLLQPDTQPETNQGSTSWDWGGWGKRVAANPRSLALGLSPRSLTLHCPNDMMCDLYVLAAPCSRAALPRWGWGNSWRLLCSRCRCRSTRPQQGQWLCCSLCGVSTLNRLAATAINHLRFDVYKDNVYEYIYMCVYVFIWRKHAYLWHY